MRASNKQDIHTTGQTILFSFAAQAGAGGSLRRSEAETLAKQKLSESPLEGEAYRRAVDLLFPPGVDTVDFSPTAPVPQAVEAFANATTGNTPLLDAMRGLAPQVQNFIRAVSAVEVASRLQRETMAERGRDVAVTAIEAALGGDVQLPAARATLRTLLDEQEPLGRSVGQILNALENPQVLAILEQRFPGAHMPAGAFLEEAVQIAVDEGIIAPDDEAMLRLGGMSYAGAITANADELGRALCFPSTVAPLFLGLETPVRRTLEPGPGDPAGAYHPSGEGFIEFDGPNGRWVREIPFQTTAEQPVQLQIGLMMGTDPMGTKLGVVLTEGGGLRAVEIGKPKVEPLDDRPAASREAAFSCRHADLVASQITGRDTPSLLALATRVALAGEVEVGILFRLPGFSDLANQVPNDLDGDDFDQEADRIFDETVAGMDMGQEVRSLPATYEVHWTSHEQDRAMVIVAEDEGPTDVFRFERQSRDPDIWRCTGRQKSQDDPRIF